MVLRGKLNGAKPGTEAMDVPAMAYGRGAFYPQGRSTGKTAGALTSAYVGMSNDNAGENPARRKSEVSWGR